MNNKKITVVIPSFNPDEKLLQVVKGLIENGFNNILLVNDGSDEPHRKHFEFIKEFEQCTVIEHESNKGKGAALKTAFSYAAENYKNSIGVITVDGDNQHQIEDIIRCMDELAANPDNVVLGSRDFDSCNVPAKSKLGNKLTRFVLKFACGINISDTQTGLRAIPLSYLNQFCKVSGERYDYETNMLLFMKEMNIPIKEVKIQTIYIDNNSSSHFNPIKDSIKVYLVIIKFIMSSIMSSLIDLGAFTLIIFLINDNLIQSERILIATATARVISSLFNFSINNKAVFKSKGSLKSSFVKYYILCICQMLVSYAGVFLLSRLTGANNILEVIFKIIVDITLFLISFQIQRRWVFKNHNSMLVH